MITTILLSLGFYFIGVIVALIVIAWFNAKLDAEIYQEVSIMSWAIAAVLLLVIFTAPLGYFYDWIYNKFKKYYETNRTKK